MLIRCQLIKIQNHLKCIFISKFRGNWNTFFNSFGKTAIEKPNEVSMKEIELRLTSVIKDFEETTNSKKRMENQNHFEKEKTNFVPSLVSKFNVYKFINRNAKNTKKNSNFSFLRGIANKNKSNNLLKTVPTNAACATTPVTNSNNPIITTLSNDKIKISNDKITNTIEST